MTTTTDRMELIPDAFKYSEGMGRKDMEKLYSANANFNNCQSKNNIGMSVVAGIVFDTDANEWQPRIPAGTPSDLVGQVVCALKHRKAKEDIRQRLVAKLAAKKK